jgi:hypothetical protein
MSDNRETTAPFWEELDQRLHYLLASATSFVDHTRSELPRVAPVIPDVPYRRMYFLTARTRSALPAATSKNAVT